MDILIHPSKHNIDTLDIQIIHIKPYPIISSERALKIDGQVIGQNCHTRHSP